MPISNTDILIKYSNYLANAGNVARGTYPNSLGGYISVDNVTSNSINNLFDDITGVQNLSRQVDYRCIFIHNNSLLTLYNTIAYIVGEAENGALIYLAADSLPPSLVGAGSPQASIIANDLTAPVGISGSFTNPMDPDSAVSLGDIGPGKCKALWIKRAAQNLTAVNRDGVAIQIQGDSAY